MLSKGWLQGDQQPAQRRLATKTTTMEQTNDGRTDDSRCQERNDNASGPNGPTGANDENNNDTNNENSDRNSQNRLSQQQQPPQPPQQNAQDVHTREKLFDFIALLQGRRMDDQRATLKPAT